MIILIAVYITEILVVRRIVMWQLLQGGINADDYKLAINFIAILWPVCFVIAVAGLLAYAIKDI